MNALRDDVHAAAQSLYPTVKEWREHLHAHPELSFQEKETAAFVAHRLTELGIPHTTGIGGYGVVGMIEGNGSGQTIALRADMDALPIQEQNEVPYKSKHPGVMHACGHDVHTSSLLGAAAILMQFRTHLPHSVKLIFQPAEEQFPGGASLMIRDGVLNNPAPAKIWGQHVHPPLAAGKVGMRQGPYMASADEVYLTIRGKGGHGAIPRDFIDPVTISAQVILALQQVVSRKADPFVPSVLSFGKVVADGATNVIPSEVRIEGTFRTFDEGWRREAHDWIRKIAVSTAEAFGGSCEARVEVGYPFVNNHPDLTRDTFAHAVNFLGEDNVVELPMRMTGEDFSYYTQQLPGCFYRLGTGNAARGINSPIHTNTFDIDPEALKTGMGLMAWLALQQ